MPRESRQLRWQDIRWQWSEDSNGKENRRQTLFPVSYSENPQNLLKNISVRGYGFRFPEGSRRAAIRIKTG